MSEKDGGSAFPIPLRDGDSWNHEKYGSPNGMSLRSYYEAAAITAAWGIAEKLGQTDVARLSGAHSAGDIISPVHLPRAVAEIARRIASNLLAARLRGE